MLIPLICYFVVICLMNITALNFDIYHKSRIPFVALGSLLFVISDNFIAWDKFIVKIPFSSLFILGTYYPAQALIITGMLTTLKEPALLYDYNPLAHVMAW